MIKDEKLARFVCALISYDRKTGKLTWKKDRISRQAGDEAGRVTPKGYREIRLCNKTVQASHIAWFLTYGYWPEELDHINNIKDDNKISNLREATRHQNLCNRGMQKNNKTGFKGVSHGKDGKIRARIKVKRKEINLGVFDTYEEASYWYQYANSYYHGEFGRAS